MNLLRRNLPCKIERKTERTRESFLAKDYNPGEKLSNNGMVPHVRMPPGWGRGRPHIAKLTRLYYKEEE